jgi:hypothetical protein
MVFPTSPDRNLLFAALVLSVERCLWRRFSG